MKNITILFLVLSLSYCASAPPKERAIDGTTPGADKSMIEVIKETAESEEGKKYIQMAKEKLKDPETQAKLKALLGKDKVPAK
jgi:hypothetical protein